MMNSTPRSRPLETKYVSLSFTTPATAGRRRNLWKGPYHELLKWQKPQTMEDDVRSMARHLILPPILNSTDPERTGIRRTKTFKHPDCIALLTAGGRYFVC